MSYAIVSPVNVGGAQSVRRAIEVVRTVAQIQRSGASLKRIAHATGLSTPTAYRLLRTLTEERLLSFSAGDRCYYVGPLAFELGLAALADYRVDPVWQKVVAEVSQKTRLTSYLIARSDDEAVCLFCAQGSTAIRAMPMEVGQRTPLGFGAGSLAILASLPDAEVERIIERHMGRYDVFPGGVVDVEMIRKRVAETRERGFSISTGTVAAGVIGLGVIAPTCARTTMTAITVSAVADHFEPAEAKKFASVIENCISRNRTARAPGHG